MNTMSIIWRAKKRREDDARAHTLFKTQPMQKNVGGKEKSRLAFFFPHTKIAEEGTKTNVASAPLLL